jgi:hypothetical protein
LLSVQKKSTFALEIIPAKHIQQELRYSHISHHHRSTPLHHSNVVNKIKPHFYANIIGVVQGKFRVTERERETSRRGRSVVGEVPVEEGREQQAIVDQVGGAQRHGCRQHQQELHCTTPPPQHPRRAPPPEKDCGLRKMESKHE